MTDQPKPWEPGFDIEQWRKANIPNSRMMTWEFWEIQVLYESMLGRIRELEAEIQVSRAIEEYPKTVKKMWDMANPTKEELEAAEKAFAESVGVELTAEQKREALERAGLITKD